MTSHKGDELVVEQSYDSEKERILRYYNKMPDQFRTSEVSKMFNITEGYARLVITRLVHYQLVLCGSGRPKTYMKVKVKK